VRERGKSCAKDDRLRESAVSKSVIVFIQKATTVTSLSAGAPVDVSSSFVQERVRTIARGDRKRQKEREREGERGGKK